MTQAVAALAWAAFTGQLAGSTGSFSSGTMVLEATTPGNVTCSSSNTSAPVSSNSARCPGDLLPIGVVGLNPTSASTTVRGLGTAVPTTATLGAPSCGVEQALDGDAHDTALAMGGVTYGTPGPLGGAGVTFDGSTGWFESTSSYAMPAAMTLLVWFEAAPGASGTIFSLSDSQFDASASASDLNLWIDASGHLVWGIDTLDAQGAQQASEVTSTAAVTDGGWHLAAATYGGTTSTLTLDGATQGTTPAGGTGLASFSGWYPSIGWGPEGSTGWADPPPSAFFGGTLSLVSLSPSAASAAQVAALAAAPSPSAYEGALSSDAPTTENWEMADSGTQAYTGAVAVSGGGTTAPCQRVEVTVQEQQGATDTCAAPAAPGACGAPSPGTLLSDLTGGVPLVVPTSTSPVTLTVTVELTGPSPTGVTGLDLLPGLAIDSARAGWTAGLSYPTQSVQL